MPHETPPVTADTIGNLALLRRLYTQYIRRHRGKLWLAAIYMVLDSAGTAGQAYMIKPVMDDIFTDRNAHLLQIIPFIIFLLSVLKGLATYSHSLLMKFVGQRLSTDMQIDLYRHLLHADVAMFSATASGNLISRFTNDIQLLRRSMTIALVAVAKEMVTLLFLLAVMLSQSVSLTLIGFLAFPIAILPILRQGRNMRKVSRKTQEQMGEYTRHLDDAFQGVRLVKAYANEGYEVERARGIMERMFGLYIRAARIESAAAPIIEALAGVAVAGVVFYGGMQVLEHNTTSGAFFSFIGALLMSYKPIKTLSSLNSNIQEGLVAVRRVFAVMDTQPAVQDTPDAKELAVRSAEIAFSNVQFRYGEDKQALHGVTFEAPAGACVALVGASGAGKSTIMNLMLRFYDPEDGGISINGQDIRGMRLQSLRGHIALVNQEATLFDDTIRANILYGRHDATEEQMVAAAKDAAAHEFILEQPQGYDTPIGQHGVRLSGGQRQRVAIARAMLKDAPILLLDEATSALDTVSEKQVQAALARLMRGRTTLVIAHRLSTILHADIIHVVDKGRIVESGSHKELLARRGAYYKLYQHQFAGQEKE